MRHAADLGRELTRVDWAVTATPLGVAQQPEASLDPRRLANSSGVVDMAYLPPRTELLRRAEASCYSVLDGGRMAVVQSVESLRLIGGGELDADRMRPHFLEFAVPATPRDAAMPSLSGLCLTPSTRRCSPPRATKSH